MPTDIWLELPAESGGGGSGVTSLNGLTGILALTSSTLSITPSGSTIDIEAQGNTNTFAGFNNSGLLESIPGFNIDTTTGGMNATLDNHPNNVGDGQAINSLTANITPLQNSPNDGRVNLNMFINGDAGNSGFNTGNITNLNMGVNLNQTGSGGGLTDINIYNNVGDGTDPITFKGMGYVFAFGDINDNVTIDGNIQGFDFQPHIHSGVIQTNNYNLTAFGDFSNIEVNANGHNSFQANPNIAGISNNHNYNGVNLNPTITAFNGNAGFSGYFSGGIIGTMSATGNYNGLGISPQVTVAHGSITGVSVNPNLIGGDGNFTGLNITPQGNAAITNSRGVTINLNGLTTTDLNGPVGLESDSRLSINASLTPTSGQTIQIGSRVEQLFQIANGSPLTGTDLLGLDLAGDLLAQDNMSVGPVGIGFSSVGFIADMAVATGKTVDLIHVFLPAVALPDPGFSTGGTTTTMEFIHIMGPLSQGGSLVTTNLYGLRIMSDFNTTSSPTNSWGISVEDTSENFLNKSLAISTSTKKVSNGSVGLELGGTTKAVRFSNLTTTQKLALTALPGMQVFDTILNQMSYYNGTTWINF